MRPGEDLITEGINDLNEGRETIASLLVSIGSPRLRALGFPIKKQIFKQPEHRLYLLLARTDPDSAHSRYNALIRRLVSFERSAARLQDEVEAKALSSIAPSAPDNA